MELIQGIKGSWIKTGGPEMLKKVNQHVRRESTLTVSGFHRDLTQEMEKGNRQQSVDVDR